LTEALANHTTFRLGGPARRLVAAAIEKIWLCISKNLHECATAASSAEKASVFLGGMHAYANPSPAAAAKQASLNTKSAISNIYKPQI